MKAGAPTTSSPLDAVTRVFLEEHLRRVNALGPDQVRLNRTASECLAAWQREIEANAAFRRAKGGLSVEELKRITGPKRAALASEVHRMMKQG